MTRPVRALIATRIHQPETSAAAFRLEAVEHGLVECGSEVRVLTTKVPGRDPVDPSGIHVSRWPVVRDSTGYVRGYVPYLSFDLPLFFRLLLTPRPDVLLVEPPPTTGVVARCAAALRRIPYVWYAADVWSDATRISGAGRAVVSVVRWMERFAVSGATNVVAVSEGVAERVRALGARRVTVIPNGIDTEVFAPDGEGPSGADLQQMGIGSHYFLYAGTASEWQGAEVFAKAIAAVRRNVPDAQVLFLGQGTSWETIRGIGEAIDVGDPDHPAVVQHPLVAPEVSARWQRGAVASLVSIRPGCGYDFAYPTKVLAALSCGTPVIFAGVGPAAEDIEHHGLGVSAPFDAQEIAGAMLKALASPKDPGRSARLNDWVQQNRSMAETGRRVAEVLRVAAAN